MTETELNALRSQVQDLRRRMKRLDDWHDTVCSPLWKRCCWWLQGFRFSSLGRWYKAPWNATAAKYE